MNNLTSQELLNINKYDKYKGKELTLIVDSNNLTTFNVLAVYLGNITSMCQKMNHYLNLLTNKPKNFKSTYLFHTIKNKHKTIYIYHKGIRFTKDSSDNSLNFPPKFLPIDKPWDRLSADLEHKLCDASHIYISPPKITLDSSWIQLIENKITDPNKLSKYYITCNICGDYVYYKFSANVYPINQQVWLESNTIIEGIKNPNTRGYPHKSPDDSNCTVFYYNYTFRCTPTKHTDWAKYSIWGTKYKCTRQGFLMNTNTIIRNCIIQGGTLGGVVDNGMGLGGGGLIELPGCASAYRDYSNNRAVCGGPLETITDGNNITYINTIKNFWTGTTGNSVSNVLVENIRANMYNIHQNSSNYTFFWSSMNINDSPHNNIILRRIVSLKTEADGINVHGNIQNFVGEDLYFENVGDDSVAIWGVGGGTKACNTHDNHKQNCPAKNNVASNIRFERVFARQSQNLGECYRIIGAKDVSLVDITCCGGNILVGTIDSYCVDYPSNSTIEIYNGRVISSNKCAIDTVSKYKSIDCNKGGYPNSKFYQMNTDNCKYNKLTNYYLNYN